METVGARGRQGGGRAVGQHSGECAAARGGPLPPLLRLSAEVAVTPEARRFGRRSAQQCTRHDGSAVRTCSTIRAVARRSIGPQLAAPPADLANFEGAARCSSSGASASVPVGQAASSVAAVSAASVAVVSVTSVASRPPIDWAVLSMAPAACLVCNHAIHSVFTLGVWDGGPVLYQVLVQVLQYW